MIGIFNALISKLGLILSALLLVLPDSPFNYVVNLQSSWVQAINYILPISEAVAHLEAYVTAVLVYYCLRVMLRWIKAVEG